MKLNHPDNPNNAHQLLVPHRSQYRSPRRTHRMRNAVLAVMATITALIAFAPATASAAPAPRIGVAGEDIWVMGHNAFCNGAIHVGVDTSPRKPGQATVILTPRGMNGIEPDWSRNPKCSVNVAIGWFFGAEYRQKVVPLTVGKGPQAPVQVPLRGVGQGVNLMSFTTHPDLNKGVSYYVIIP